jgi:hypothetical protein
MGRKKRKSNVLIEASKKLSGLKAIDPNLDFGEGFTVKSYEESITATSTMLDDYNMRMASLDDLGNLLTQTEKELNSKNTRVMSLVSGRFGADSSQYELVGGTRISERKKRPRGVKKNKESA